MRVAGTRVSTRCKIVIAFVAIFGCTSIKATEFDGMFLQSCLEQRDDGSAKNSVCLGFLRGLIAGLKGGSVSETKAGGYCPPDQGYSPDQARLIIQKFLRENPQALHQQADVLAAAALLRAFPCPPRSRK